METERQELEARIVKKAWEDEVFRKRLFASPKEVIEQEIGQSLPDDVEIKVVEETDKVFYFRLPLNPDNLPDTVLDLVAAGSGCDKQCNSKCHPQEGCTSLGG